MKRNSLPPGFYAFTRKEVVEAFKEEHQIKYIPNIIFFFDETFLYRKNQLKKFKKIQSVDFYRVFWFETNVISCYCEFDPDLQILSVTKLDIRFPGSYDKWYVHVNPEYMRESMDSLRENRKQTMNKILFGLYLTTVGKNEKSSVFTMNRNKASIHYKEGDETSFKRIFSAKKLPSADYEPPEPGSSGIRKKEHEVVGHWRHYKSGAKVWVRPHKRGDPDLGRITSVIS